MPAPHQWKRSLSGVLWCCAVLSLCLRMTAAHAQMPVTEGSTIHVYTNLLQIPVLILDRRHQELPPISPAKFTVQLGKDTPFRPRLVRLEDEDPITLAILLDGSSRDALLPLTQDALAEMASEHLHARDRVSVYAMDGCKFRRLATLGPPAGLPCATASPALLSGRHTKAGSAEQSPVSNLWGYGMPRSTSSARLPTSQEGEWCWL